MPGRPFLQIPGPTLVPDRREGFADEARVVRSDVAAFLDGPPPPEAPFDLVFADPPYDVGAEALGALVEHLGAPGWLSPGATLSIEGPVGSGILLPKSFRTGCWS